MALPLSCGTKCAKYILFVFNFIFWLSGLILVIAGIWFLVDTTAFHYIGIASNGSSDSLLKWAAAIILIVGVVVFIIGGLGCWGASQENKCILTLFSVVLGILVVLQIIAAILAGAYHNQLLDELEHTLNKTLQTQYGVDPNSAISQGWNLMQYEMKCCGVWNGTDWSTSVWRINSTADQTVPNSCCALTNNNYQQPVPINAAQCYKEATSPSDTHDYGYFRGCSTSLKNWMSSYIGALIGIAAGLVIIQVVGIVLSCSLYCSLTSGYEYV